jgi:hypothetical protein
MKGKTMSAMNQPKGYGYGSNAKEPSGDYVFSESAVLLCC